MLPVNIRCVYAKLWVKLNNGYLKPKHEKERFYAGMHGSAVLDLHGKSAYESIGMLRSV